ncbi:MAG: Na+/H+ antiporter NhaA [Dehalococcoidia bacterium]|nr:Na+/H+ antiporter NhaA [Dehalococcoidia bacterium]
MTRPLRNYLATETGGAALLIAASVVALVWANSPWSAPYESIWNTVLSIHVGSYQLSMDLRRWVNDGLMVLFFFVVGLEVRREISVGELAEPRSLVLPVVAALGGAVIPAALYLLLNPSGDAARGWGVVVGTDTAFLLGALTLVGPRLSTQLRVFLLTLTIGDDLIAVSVIALFYADSINLVALMVAVACLGVFALLSQLRAWQTTAYAIVGLVLWVATVESGVHPSISGMVAGLLIAAHPPERDAIERAASLFRAFRQSPLPAAGRSAKIGLQQAVSVNERLQAVWHPWTSYWIVPIFAFANAGVDLRGGLLQDALRSPITWGVVLGLVVGKPVGIAVATFVVVRLGWGSLPRGVGSGQLVGGGALSGIGFTVSLLVTALAFESSTLAGEATVGVLLAAVLSTANGWVIFRLAAVVLGERTAVLPMVLDPPVDAGRDHVRGRAAAQLTLAEYGDFECPFCSGATGIIADLADRLGDDFRYVFRHLPLTDVHPHAELAAQAAEAAAAQGRFWEMHDLLFLHQDQLELPDLVGYAARLGLDVERFARELESGQHLARIRQDVLSAEESGARGTPTFFIGSRRHTGAYDVEKLFEELTETMT